MPILTYSLNTNLNRWTLNSKHNPTVNVKRRRDMTIMDGILATKLQCHPDGTLILQL